MVKITTDDSMEKCRGCGAMGCTAHNDFEYIIDFPLFWNEFLFREEKKFYEQLETISNYEFFKIPNTTRFVLKNQLAEYEFYPFNWFDMSFGTRKLFRDFKIEFKF